MHSDRASTVSSSLPLKRAGVLRSLLLQGTHFLEANIKRLQAFYLTFLNSAGVFLVILI